EGRTRETLSAFFAQMTEEQKVGIEAVAMDMWEPYIQAVGDALPNAKIVFDLFHVVAAYGKVIDRVRNSEMSKATLSQRALIRGTKYLLLKRHVTDPDERERLRKLLQANETLSTVYILKEMLVRIWRYRSRAWAARALAEWCALARMVPHPEPSRFARTLERYRQGILNHCEFPIHNSKLEGVNNKIKVIKRRAYGYHDDRYFVLKVKQAFDPESDVLFRR
ncbi:MAG: ISL3 family transposase, partial [Candidatus Brocadiaceae bacterium]|nr:ISL3 family transposase [Candidatus Brocadiaceae bacterium]